MKIVLLIVTTALAAGAPEGNHRISTRLPTSPGTGPSPSRAGQVKPSRNPALNSELVQKRIDADIDARTNGQGPGGLVASGPSDLNVRYRLGTARKSED